MKKTRTLLAAAAAIAGLAAFAGPAQAAPPQPFDPFILQANDDLGGGYCSFPVLVEGFSKSGFKGPDDRVTGFTSATVTNMDTGKKLTFNASGPGTFTNNPDGSFSLDASGPWLTWTTVENSEPAGVLQLAYTNGHLHYEVDKNGNTQVYTLDGKSQDVCALLA